MKILQFFSDSKFKDISAKNLVVIFQVFLGRDDLWPETAPSKETRRCSWSCRSLCGPCIVDEEELQRWEPRGPPSIPCVEVCGAAFQDLGQLQLLWQDVHTAPGIHHHHHHYHHHFNITIISSSPFCHSCTRPRQRSWRGTSQRSMWTRRESTRLLLPERLGRSERLRRRPIWISMPSGWSWTWKLKIALSIE